MMSKLNDVPTVYEGMLLGYIDDLGALQLMKDAVELRIREVESSLRYEAVVNCQACQLERELGMVATEAYEIGVCIPAHTCYAKRGE